MTKKRLRIGNSNYKSLIESNSYFVDKTLFIQEIIDNSYDVLLLSRPPRFGKTLNLSMLNYFFDARQKDTAKLFTDYKIWKTGNYYTQQQAKFPVIHLSLANTKGMTFEECLYHIKSSIIKLHKEHDYLLESKILRTSEKRMFHKIIDREASTLDFQNSLKALSDYLSTYYKQKVVVLLDEYDRPIHAGFNHGYFDKASTFMKGMMGYVFKDNDYLQKGVITGILRISKDSIFSDLNNIGVFTVLDKQLSTHFGFSEQETKDLLQYFNLEEHFEQVKAWYEGYNVNAVKQIYNPWSIINYVDNQAFKSYWVNTSFDELIKNQIMSKSTQDIQNDIEILLSNKSIVRTINTNIVFSDLGFHKEVLWSILVFSGYLIAEKTTNPQFYSLRIPNLEIKTLFKKIISE